MKKLFNFLTQPLLKTTYSFAVILYLFSPLPSKEESFLSNTFACLFWSFLIVSIVISFLENFDKRKKIIVEEEKNFYLLIHLQKALKNHLEITDFEVKTIQNKTKVFNLSEKELKEKKIKMLEENYNTFIESFKKWKDSEISFILENKSH